MEIILAFYNLKNVLFGGSSDKPQLTEFLLCRQLFQ